MDPVVLAPLIAGGCGVIGGGAGGGLLGWLLTRKQRTATIELTEAQADQIRAAVWAQLNETLRVEIIRLQGRVADLENRLAALDSALREKDAALVATQAERDSLRIELAVAQSQLEATQRENDALKSALAASNTAPADPQPRR